MPDDKSFPMPGDKTTLTDPVAPDLSQPTDSPTDTNPADQTNLSDTSEVPPSSTPQSAPPPSLDLDQPQAPTITTPPPIEQPQPEPITPVAPPPPPPPELKPASLPKTANSSAPIVTIILILISISACAASYFFYLQSKSLNDQLVKINQTLENQRLAETETTSTPTPTLTPTTTPVATPTATLTPTITASPTPPPQANTILINTMAFKDVTRAISFAQQQYPKAQLLMVTANNAQSDTEVTLKYWFRQTEDTKKYLYVLKEPGKEMTVVDQQVYVSPDNNIPSLNTMATNNQLGIDLDQAVRISSEACPATNYDCKAATITAQFIKANTTLWQITYRYNNKPFVVQIDSITQKILYKSNP